MTFHVFRLDDASRTQQGIVVIFETPVPQVWRRLASDEQSEEIPHTVTEREAPQLLQELKALPIGDDPTQIGGTLLQQTFHDGTVTHGHRAIYVGPTEFTAMSATPSAGSFRGWVEHSYQQQTGQRADEHER